MVCFVIGKEKKVLCTHKIIWEGFGSFLFSLYTEKTIGIYYIFHFCNRCIMYVVVVQKKSKLANKINFRRKVALPNSICTLSLRTLTVHSAHTADELDVPTGIYTYTPPKQNR